ADLDFLVGSDRLWAADGTSGDLMSYHVDSGTPERRVHKGVHQPGSSKLGLTVANNEVVVVDRTHHVVVRVDDSGSPVSSIPLSLRDDDLVSGSPRDSRVLIVRRSAAVFRVCPLNGGACTADVAIGRSNADLGAAVEAQDHVFIPDHTNGTVHVVDVGRGTVRETERLLKRTNSFELVVRDGTAYFNDPDSEKAGVIDISGNVRRIDKYDPAKPPPTEFSSATSSRTNSVTRTTPSPIPRTGRRISGTTSSGTIGTIAAPTGSSTASSLRIGRINTEPVTPETGQTTTFTAEVAGVPPETWSWSVAPAGGQAVPVASTPRFEHVFTQPGAHVVSLTVKAGSLEDRRLTTVQVVPPAPPVKCGDVIMTSVVLRADLTCTGPGLVVQTNDITVDLDGHTISGSGTDNGITVENQQHVRIFDGSVRGFATGIKFFGVPDGEIERVAVSGNSSNALILDAGGLAGRAPGVEVTASEIRGRAMFHGLLNLTVTGLRATDSLISFDSTAQSVMTGVVCTRCFMNIGSDSNGVTVRGSFTDGNVNVSQSDDLKIDLSEFVRNSIRIGSASRRATVSRSRLSGADTAISSLNLAPGLKIESNWFSENRIGAKIVSAVLDELAGLTITGNEFLNNRAAGVLVDVDASSPVAGYFFGQNHFTSNGHQSDGLKDGGGSPVNDGLHLRIVGDGQAEIRENITANNAEYGIEATAAGVVDGGGNRSTNDPAGCLGVRCE
ncbi:PKD domain-containing protein, partial [Lentzea sp. NPDC006480]|uniref:PKD domain-containing protein n=1 Tax=Lentzea sp. NPDC006480 TaxID=3157176 RepID=UPI0033B87DF4